MDHPTLMPARRAGPDTDVLPAYVPLPGLGIIPVNAFVIRARQPVLVDTGIAPLREGFLRALRQLIDPADLRWIWLTHADADHAGNLREVLAEAPQARIVTNYLGTGKLGLLQLPVERVHLLNPGQALDVGDRRLVAQRPPVYDAPETMAAFDSRTRHLFSADCFGAVMARPAEQAGDIQPRDLHEGQVLWAGIDAPWLSELGPARMAAANAPLRELRPSLVLGSHLPPAAPALHEALFQALCAAAAATPFVGPGQAEAPAPAAADALA